MNTFSAMSSMSAPRRSDIFHIQIECPRETFRSNCILGNRFSIFRHYFALLRSYPVWPPGISFGPELHLFRDTIVNGYCLCLLWRSYSPTCTLKTINYIKKKKTHWNLPISKSRSLCRCTTMSVQIRARRRRGYRTSAFVRFNKSDF